MRANQAKLVEAAKTANKVKNNSSVPQAVRPKDNSSQQGRPGSRDRTARTSQVSFRRNRRHTSFDGSSSDNGNDARGSLSRNRRSSPRVGVSRQENVDRIGEIPNSRSRSSNNG